MSELAQRTPARFVRVLMFLLPLAGLTWLSSMLIHEMGHVLAAIGTGGKLAVVDVRPWRFSTTLVSPNPFPSVVVWSGLLMGWLVPLVSLPFWKMKSSCQSQVLAIGPLLKTWSAFCWLSMGSYLALALGESFSDSGMLLREGWSPVVLCVTGIVVAVIGYRVGQSGISELSVVLGNKTPTVLAIVIAWILVLVWWAAQAALAIFFERLL